MTTADHISTAPQARAYWRKFLPSRLAMPALATLIVAVGMYLTAGMNYPGFFSLRVIVDFFVNNSSLGIAALGETIVILVGGIDLSVGSMIGCTSIVIATLVQTHHWPFGVAAALVVMGGTIIGAITGWVIHKFTVAPFLVTLGSLFILRGVGLLVSTHSIAMTSRSVIDLSGTAINLQAIGLRLPLTGLVFVGVALLLAMVMRWTAFGRNVYAVGGSEPSAVLMGLPVGSTKIAVYAVSGACAALAGVVFSLSTANGNATTGVGLELDAIAATVVGGTLLTGGVGYVLGTVVGVLAFGVIQTAIVFDGRVSSWWTRIFIGGLLLIFIALQRLIAPRSEH